MYLEPALLDSARTGSHNFLTILSKTLLRRGWAVEYRPTGPAERAAAPSVPGYALFHMEAPTHDAAFTFRRVYHYPFWAIERTAERWDWTVAQTAFDPEAVPRREADGFYRRWQARLFGDRPAKARRDGVVYVPLQGLLTRQRSFQSAAPVDMLAQVMDRESERKVVATLHPKEIYSARDLDALKALAERHERLHISRAPMEEMLEVCDYVVTENSSAAFSAMFFGKPSILFARVDFHHVCLGPGDFDRIAGHAPDFAGYVWWFWQKMAINAGHPSAEDRIVAAFRRGGLPI